MTRQPNLRRTRAAALHEFATTYMTQGDLAAAQAAAEQSRDIIAKLAAADPGNAGWQRDLSVSWNKLGDVRAAQGDLPGALQAYTAGQGSPPSWRRPTPATPVAARPLRQLGAVRVDPRGQDDALTRWRHGDEALLISEGLATNFPDSVAMQTTAGGPPRRRRA